jgi:predicted HicB family RNase H-like nuclease
VLARSGDKSMMEYKGYFGKVEFDYEAIFFMEKSYVLNGRLKVPRML